MSLVSERLDELQKQLNDLEREYAALELKYINRSEQLQMALKGLTLVQFFNNDKHLSSVLNRLMLEIKAKGNPDDDNRTDLTTLYDPLTLPGTSIGAGED